MEKQKEPKRYIRFVAFSSTTYLPKLNKKKELRLREINRQILKLCKEQEEIFNEKR